ncbi:hypothetical protein [Acinetobacter lwoffii]|uniref:hypothetical protein n=1 Tax=Acinetobacter lwoffii TaxID=28090 RepID=UPI001FF5F983|nr:hypothetical protein [Acinetobacter lwoffii]MCJ8511863.1 hypothetical protein [Acinetobacter lwoffii]
MTKHGNTSEILLTTTENLSDEILFKTANSFLEDAVKSIPFASLITGSIETYTRFRILKEQKQLLAFIQETENLDNGFVEKFFKQKSNAEIGLEILGILDQTYLERQARMVGRVTLLLKDKKISKQEFDKYTYIITKLNNHLITLIENLYLEYSINPHQRIVSIPLANMDLISFGFIKKLADGSWFSEAQNNTPYDYKIQEEYFFFYKYIFKD